MTTDYKTSIYKKHLVRVINKDYDRNIKESSLSPPGGIHTQESVLASVGHLQQEEIKPLVLSCTQQDLPVRRKEKTPRVCKAI